MGQVINKRPFRTFLSHAHTDGEIVKRLFLWCRDYAGRNVWFDGENFPSGLIGSELGNAIVQCQSAIIVLSKTSIQSRWVEQEWNLCIKEQAAFPDFQIILLQIEDCEPPPFLSIRKWIETRGEALSLNAAVQVIEALHWQETNPATIRQKSIYLACGSRPLEMDVNREVVGLVRDLGFRIVRDAPDQEHYSETRVADIMRACCGVLAVVPHRGNGLTSRYISDEIKLAEATGTSPLVLLDKDIRDPSFAAPAYPCVRIPFDAAAVDQLVAGEVALFAEQLPSPKKDAYIFFGSQIKEDRSMRIFFQRTVQCVSGIPCVFGDEILGGIVQDKIRDTIGSATFCIFDISDERLNTCVEAGIALGAGARFELVCRGPRRRPPFMFRHRQVWFYDDYTDLVGLIRKLCLPYRRVVQ